MKIGSRLSYSMLLNRLALGAVFVLFGYDKLLHPEHWVLFITPQINRFSPISTYDFLKFQGVVETLLGVSLGVGVLTRAAASATTVILGLIVFFLWPDPIAVRDAGLFLVSLALVLSGPGPWSLDALLQKASE